MATFQVDPVKPASAPLPTHALGSREDDTLALGGDPETPVIAHAGTHAVLGAVAIAFAEHRPLVLSPDVVWLTIAQGVAQHVRLHAEALRSRLVRHDGRKQLTLQWSGPMPTDRASWEALVPAFRGLIAEEIGEGPARLFECDFSTSTEVERIASQIVLLDAYSPYYSLGLTCVCGIPSVTLTGTVADWRRIRERIDVIAELDLGFWCRSLVPIADQLVQAADGLQDLAFWRRIYNPVDAYGGDVITGWISRLYPYLKRMGVVTTRNPMLALPIDQPRDITSSKQRSYRGPGIRSDEVADSRSHVPIHIRSAFAGDPSVVALEAGVVAIAQDPDGGLRPIVGWRLAPASVQIGDVLDRIEHHHRTVPVDPARAELGAIHGSGEVGAMYARFASATLFKGGRAWKIRPVTAHEVITIESDAGASATFVRMIDLPEGRSLCCEVARITRAPRAYDTPKHWIVGRVGARPGLLRFVTGGRAGDSPDEIRVLGTSLAAILDAALESGGEIDHLETHRLAQLLAE